VPHYPLDLVSLDRRTWVPIPWPAEFDPMDWRTVAPQVLNGVPTLVAPEAGLALYVIRCLSCQELAFVLDDTGPMSPVSICWECYRVMAGVTEA